MPIVNLLIFNRMALCESLFLNRKVKEHVEHRSGKIA